MMKEPLSRDKAGEQQEQCVASADFVRNKRPYKWITNNLSVKFQMQFKELCKWSLRTIRRFRTSCEVGMAEIYAYD